MKNTVPELPIFKTVDSAQRIRIVWAFYAAGVLHEYDTRELAEEARQKMIKRAKRKVKSKKEKKDGRTLGIPKDNVPLGESSLR